MFIKQIPPKALLPSCRIGMNVVRGASAISLALLLILTTWVGSAGAQTGFQMRTDLVVNGVLPGSSFAAGYDATYDSDYDEDIIIAEDDTEPGSGGVARAIHSNYADSSQDGDTAVGIVDWVEVEFVAIPTGNDILPIPAASDTVSRYKTVALLLSDGSIVDPGELNDATPPRYELAAMLAGINADTNATTPALTIPSGEDGLGDVSGKDIYIIVNHRNHIAVLSNEPADIIEDDYVYDFTTGVDKARGGISALIEVTLGSASEYAMYGGDSNQDQVNVNAADPSDILAVEGSFSYSPTDISLDGNSNQGDVSIARSHEGISRQFTP